MLEKNWRIERYIMLGIVLLSLVMDIISRLLISQVFPNVQFQYNIIMIVRWIILILILILHVNYKQIIGVVYIVYAIFSTIQSAQSMMNAPWNLYNWTHIVTLISNLFFSIFALITCLILFFKKDLFHPLYIILPSLLLFLSLPQIITSVIPGLMLSFQHGGNAGSILMIANLLSFITTILFYIILLLFAIGLYQTSKGHPSQIVIKNKKLSSNQIYDMLHELENLYGDGILSKEEYESKKRELLAQKA